MRYIPILALVFPLAALAGEHPKEHPTSAEHPAEQPQPMSEMKLKPKPKKEAPEGSKAWSRQMSQEFGKFVSDSVRAESEGGGFKIEDEKLGKTWELKLVRVHKDKLVHLGGKRFFACADFNSLNSKDTVDLDFYAVKGEEGWTMESAYVHKVNAQPRYTYNEKNEMVPAK